MIWVPLGEEVLTVPTGQGTVACWALAASQAMGTKPGRPGSGSELSHAPATGTQTLD